ncbi:MAG: hypothetical protein R3C39_12820 [Dehalococcoidia bacterium]
MRLPGRPSRGARRATALVVAVAAAALLTVGCSQADNSSDAASQEAADQAAAQVTEYDITIQDHQLNPAHVIVQVPANVLLVVKNESSTDCSFGFGPYSTIEVAAGAEARDTLTVFSSSDAPSALTMGCADSSERSGDIELQDLNPAGA